MNSAIFVPCQIGGTFEKPAQEYDECVSIQHKPQARDARQESYFTISFPFQGLSVSLEKLGFKKNYESADFWRKVREDGQMVLMIILKGITSTPCTKLILGSNLFFFFKYLIRKILSNKKCYSFDFLLKRSSTILL